MPHPSPTVQEQKSSSQESLRYRILDPSEWDKLKDIFPDHQILPSPEVAIASVAEDGDKIVGVLFLQMVYHVEPLIISEEARSRVNYFRLHKNIESAVKDSLGPGQATASYLSAPSDRDWETW